jgi:hypothetical protein
MNGHVLMVALGFTCVKGGIRPTYRSNVNTTMVLITRFTRLTKGLTHKFNVSIDMSWAIECAMLIRRPTFESTIVNGVFMLCVHD